MGLQGRRTTSVIVHTKASRHRRGLACAVVGPTTLLWVDGYGMGDDRTGSSGFSTTPPCSVGWYYSSRRAAATASSASGEKGLAKTRLRQENLNRRRMSEAQPFRCGQPAIIIIWSNV